MTLKLVNNQKDPKNLVSDVTAQIKPSGIREFFDIVYSTPDCISLGVGEPDFTTPWNICDSAIFALKEGHTHYTPNRGLPELCDVISDYLLEKYSLSYDPKSEMIITMGVSQALDLALRSIINPGDEVIVFEPNYVSYTENVSILYGTPIILSTIQEDGFYIDLDELKNAITPKTKAIILNYPCNPSGATLNKDTLSEIAQLALKHNLIIISDEIYAALSYENEHVSIAELENMRERTIYLNGLSKSHAMTGWRIGYVCGPQYLIDIMLKIHQYIALCASSIAQIAAVEAIKNGKNSVIAMKQEYKRRRNYIVQRMNDASLTCHMPKGAFYIFPSIASTGLEGKEFALKLLESKKVAVVPGAAFGDSCKNYIRCSYATSMENLKESMDRIEEFVKQL